MSERPAPYGDSPPSTRISEGELLLHLLIFPAERLAFRLSFLRIGFALAFGVLTQAHRTIAARPQKDLAWRLFALGAQDWKALDREHLESFRVFVEGLRAQPKEAR